MLSKRKGGMNLAGQLVNAFFYSRAELAASVYCLVYGISKEVACLH
jgi:hypothetical protein